MTFDRLATEARVTTYPSRLIPWLFRALLAAHDAGPGQICALTNWTAEVAS